MVDYLLPDNYIFYTIVTHTHTQNSALIVPNKQYLNNEKQNTY